MQLSPKLILAMGQTYTCLRDAHAAAREVFHLTDASNDPTGQLEQVGSRVAGHLQHDLEIFERDVLQHLGLPIPAQESETPSRFRRLTAEQEQDILNMLREIYESRASLKTRKNAGFISAMLTGESVTIDL